MAQIEQVIGTVFWLFLSLRKNYKTAVVGTVETVGNLSDQLRALTLRSQRPGECFSRVVEGLLFFTESTG